MPVDQTTQQPGTTDNSSLRDRAGEFYQNASARTGEFYADARERTSAAGRRTAETVENYPLAAVVGGLGLGLLLGAVLPRTRREAELLGPYGREVTTRAREAFDAGREAGMQRLEEFDFVKEAAREAADKFVDGARSVAREAGSAATRKSGDAG